MDTVAAALARQGQTTKSINRWYDEMPREQEMLPKDKYTIFDKKERRYRKSIHSMFLDPRGRLGLDCDGLFPQMGVGVIVSGHSGLSSGVGDDMGGIVACLGSEANV